MRANKEIVTAIFAETAKGNGRPYVEAMADDVLWRIIGSGFWSGTFYGAELVTSARGERI